MFAALSRGSIAFGEDGPIDGGGAGTFTYCDGCYRGKLGPGELVRSRVEDGGCSVSGGFYLEAWQFDHNTTSQVSFFLDALERNPKLVLVDAACNVIAENDGCEAKSNFPEGQIWKDAFSACISRVLSPGTYFLLVTTSQPQPSLEYSLEAVTPTDYYPPCATEALITVFIPTNAYHYEVTSGSGAVGDVVPVTVSLHSRVTLFGLLNTLSLLLCHDPAILEVVGNPVYSQEFLAISSPSLDFKTILEGSVPGNPRGYGIEFNTGLPGHSARFPSLDPVPIMTLYYRVKGVPGQTGQLSFCNTLEFGDFFRCRTNKLSTLLPTDPEEDRPRFHTFHSHGSKGGTITVLPGPATRPDRPPEPPEARVYNPQPTKAQVNFRIRVSSGVAQPGDRDVPVEIYARADVEYAGILLPIDFDERYLRLARAEHHFVIGVTQINNDNLVPGANDTEGWCTITNGLGINNYRLAAEGEEVHAATLYFDILSSAAEISETTLTASTVYRGQGGQQVQYFPWVSVRHPGGIGAGAESGEGAQADVAQSRVEPSSIQNGRLLIPNGPQLFRRGDSNEDGTLDLSDAVFTLGFLFVGGVDPLCLDAADTTDDGTLDISDAVLVLNVLFSGVGTIPPPNAPGLDPTPDPLGCSYYP